MPIDFKTKRNRGYCFWAHAEFTSFRLDMLRLVIILVIQKFLGSAQINFGGSAVSDMSSAQRIDLHSIIISDMCKDVLESHNI